MDISESTRRLELTPHDNKRLAKLCGQFDENLHFIERHLGVEINNRGSDFEIIGIPKSVDKAAEVLKSLYKEAAYRRSITPNEVLIRIRETQYPESETKHKEKVNDYELKTHQLRVKARTPNQQHYLNAIQKYDINFGIGPSGTGKTFLAVACAVSALEKEEVSRIVLTRPAVEAGEKLGYLPGDLTQKIDPYLRPLYDALFEMIGIAKVSQLSEKGIIEIAPLAYMRGRTLNDSFVILDEAQNATREQMKMFLTRIGFGSKAVITGDITQTDLPKTTESGLRHAITLLRDIDEIQFTFFKSNDIVRHPVVQRIIEAYEEENAE
ncbi:PhoH family protein [Coxiella burnetii]|uniref:PhoH-like protein n=1 Tax=Coxiella burnetii (strain RSA 493 / Nine Mile phase I) TaxID=227377 RepID=Q83DX4_COXBU|nr:PhoH family protein [Coxiella burnetii]NP_819598.1 PhoH-like protein [Coxiella burnetii RSA 493]AAO90112.1 PhoH-like protein [Coxiella burnetii RSA 493]ABX77696.1 PhoH family protein [Coxiella burnetii RSA 331]ACJ18733.1 PhoH-like protein [Coxiella burnetii CbuG_Q212]AML49504.1 phosphate starvation-inducible protein PhoH [Coxiella burnetii]AML55417.1 phosphate starvation-inducible protein PhoH [Coxiella burnetii]